MNPMDMITEIKKVTGIFEVHHKTVFECYRKTKSGGTQEVTVEISDMGEDEGTRRYSCVATSEGKVAKGNAERSVELALSVVHWQDLD